MTKISGYLLCLLAVGAAACAELEVPEGAAGGGADDLAVVTEELGSWSKRYQAQLEGESQSLTSDYFVLVQTTGGGCYREVEVVLMPSAVRLATPSIPDSPGCEGLSAVYGARGMVFVADERLRRLWRLRNDEAGIYWVQIATLPGIEISTIRHDGTHVFWSDTHGVHKVPVGGGAVTTLFGGLHDLLDLDGSNLYIEQHNWDDNNYTLLRQPTAGGAPTSLRTMADEFTHFTFNSTHVYFTQYKTNDWQRIYKMAKNPGGVSVFAEVNYGEYWITSIAANETHVYWVQDDGDADANRVHRRRISDEQHSDIHCKGDRRCGSMVLTSNYLYVVGEDVDATEAVWRGQL